jgi:hypothetical protein
MDYRSILGKIMDEIMYRYAATGMDIDKLVLYSALEFKIGKYLFENPEVLEQRVEGPPQKLTSGVLLYPSASIDLDDLAKNISIPKSQMFELINFWQYIERYDCMNVLNRLQGLVWLFKQNQRTVEIEHNKFPNSR